MWRKGEPGRLLPERDWSCLHNGEQRATSRLSPGSPGSQVPPKFSPSQPSPAVGVCSSRRDKRQRGDRQHASIASLCASDHNIWRKCDWNRTDRLYPKSVWVGKADRLLSGPVRASKLQAAYPARFRHRMETVSIQRMKSGQKLESTCSSGVIHAPRCLAIFHGRSSAIRSIQ
jgi:hypothetical protein